MKTAPDAQIALELLRDVFVVEHDVRNAGLVGTEQHASARWERSLFVGHEQAGANLAALYTVVPTCLAHDLDPLAYLTDVLMRLDSTPADDIDILLPNNWDHAP